MIENVFWSWSKVPATLVRFYFNLNFLDTFSKNTHMYTVMTNHLVGSELFRAVRRTDGRRWRSY